jgi:sodium/bile acid cotransporter 7
LGGLITVAVLAWWEPGWGSSDGPLHSKKLSSWGIVIIFLIQGLSLSGESLRHGFKNWRLHVWCQVGIFVGFPLMATPLILMARPWLPQEVEIGFWFLAFLPTTVSTAVVFTGQAKGDVTGALFNVTLANVLGVFISPPILAWLLAAERGIEVPLAPLLGQVAVLILLPFAVGQGLRPWFQDWVKRHAFALGQVTNVVILFIVFAALSNFFQTQEDGHLGKAPIWPVCVLTVILLGLSRWLAWQALKKSGLQEASRVAAFFCISEKTLAAGVPMATLVFAAAGESVQATSGLILMPILIYHPLQLALDSILGQGPLRVKG